MQLELHLLQSFPPANLNRDENNMPKNTTFGGYPRARISSQCQKRAIRKYYHKHSGLSAEQFADRSRSWLPNLKKLLVDQNINEVHAEKVARLTLIDGLKLKLDDDSKSKTIVFLGRTELESIANILVQNWDDIEPGLAGDNPTLPKKDPNIIKGIEKALVDTGKPGDVALFGRMMASLPTVNVDAAVQMAHAIGVNRLQQEFDFFTAVDDLDVNDDMGADHMGEVGYNSSTYYRFTTVDTEQLTKNLGSKDYLEDVIKAFATAFIESIPSGHKNSFAPYSKPAVVMAVVRDGQPVSLVDAFEDPIYSRSGVSILGHAVKALDDHWSDLKGMYGDKSLYQGIAVCSKLIKQLKTLKTAQKDTVAKLLEEAITVALSGGK